MVTQKRINELEGIAKKVRRNLLTSVYESQAGHLGGSLSWVDIGTFLYFEGMNCDCENPDRLILSKGHGVPAQYALLATKGEIEEESLCCLRKIDSPLQGHPVVGTHPRIHASTGALGQGLSMGIGYSIADKILGSACKTYVILGDGECQEGQVWEAAMSAPTLYKQGKLGNLIAFVDKNDYQGQGAVKDIMPSLHPLKEKWESFGWDVYEVDGNNINDIARICEFNGTPSYMHPRVIIANTRKGAGVGFMEENPTEWHGGSLDKELYEKAIEGLK